MEVKMKHSWNFDICMSFKELKSVYKRCEQIVLKKLKMGNSSWNHRHGVRFES